MPPATPCVSPGLQSFLKSLKVLSANDSVDHFISLLKRRQISNSRPCAIATTNLLLCVVKESKFKQPVQLTDRIREVGRRLVESQPRELVIGNIIRRVLGLVREITDANGDSVTNPTSAEETSKGAASQAQASLLNDSLFNLMSNPSLIASDDVDDEGDNGATSLQVNGADGPNNSLSMRDVKDDMLNGIREMLDELDQADEQIAGYSLEHIHPNEIILTTTASTTVQKFLVAAAKKRKFTVVYAESYPNEHLNTHEMAVYGRKRETIDGFENDNRFKPLTSVGIKVIVIPDSNIFALMPTVNQVFLAAQSVFSNGGFIAAAGSKVIAKAAQLHRVPVTVLSGVYKFSPSFPFDSESFLEHGDPERVLDYRDGSLVEAVEVFNPLHDYVPPDLVDLYITNLGAHAPSYIYRIAADHYHEDDIEL